MLRHAIEGLRFIGQAEAMNSVNLIAQKRRAVSDNIHINIQCKQGLKLTVINSLTH